MVGYEFVAFILGVFAQNSYQSCLTAYCTGLLLARRALKRLELDEEYEGNTEVWHIHTAIYHFGFVDQFDTST